MCCGICKATGLPNFYRNLQHLKVDVRTGNKMSCTSIVRFPIVWMLCNECVVYCKTIKCVRTFCWLHQSSVDCVKKTTSLDLRQNVTATENKNWCDDLQYGPCTVLRNPTLLLQRRLTKVSFGKSEKSLLHSSKATSLSNLHSNLHHQGCIGRTM